MTGTEGLQAQLNALIEEFRRSRDHADAARAHMQESIESQRELLQLMKTDMERRDAFYRGVKWTMRGAMLLVAAVALAWQRDWAGAKAALSAILSTP